MQVHHLGKRLPGQRANIIAGKAKVMTNCPSANAGLGKPLPPGHPVTQGDQNEDGSVMLAIASTMLSANC
jgi:hypothetical protein